MRETVGRAKKAGRDREMTSRERQEGSFLPLLQHGLKLSRVV